MVRADEGRAAVGAEVKVIFPFIWLFPKAVEVGETGVAVGPVGKWEKYLVGYCDEVGYPVTIGAEVVEEIEPNPSWGSIAGLGDGLIRNGSEVGRAVGSPVGRTVARGINGNLISIG